MGIDFNNIADTGLGISDLFNATQNPKNAAVKFASSGANKNTDISSDIIDSSALALLHPNASNIYEMIDSVSNGQISSLTGMGGSDVASAFQVMEHPDNIGGDLNFINSMTGGGNGIGNLISDATGGLTGGVPFGAALSLMAKPTLENAAMTGLSLACPVAGLALGAVSFLAPIVTNLFGGGRQSKELDNQDAGAVSQTLSPDKIKNSHGRSIDDLAKYVHSVECSDKGGHEKWQQNDDISNRIKDLSDKTSDPAQKASLRKLYDGIQGSFHHDGSKSADQMQQEAFATYKQETASQMGGFSRGSRSQNYGNSGCGNAYMPNNMSSAGLSPALSLIIKEALSEKDQEKADSAAAEQAIALQLMQSQNTQKNKNRHKHHHHHKDTHLNVASNKNSGGIKVTINI